MKRALLSVLGLVAAGLGMGQMAEFTMSRHEPVPPDSRMAVVVQAHTKGDSADRRLQMTRSLFMACRLEANTTVVEDDFRAVGPDTFRFVLKPALDDSDQRQLRGCLEDSRIDQLQLAVRSIEPVTPKSKG